MSFTVGRASFDNNPSGISHSGDLVQFDVDILPSTLAEAKVLRQQVLGLANNPDEPVVPVTWSADSDYDGFYRVLSVDVDPVQSYLSNNLMRARLSLERVGGYSAALATLRWIATSRVVASSEQAVVWIPAAYNWQEIRSSSSTRTAESGAVAGFDVTTGGATHDESADFSMAAADWYTGAAVVEQLVGGSWYTIIGEQVPELSPEAIRLNNGLMRMTWQLDGDIVAEAYNGSTWDAIDDFTLIVGSDVVVPAGAPAILRNTPERCTIRYSANNGTEADYARIVTVSLTRGNLFTAWTYRPVGTSSFGAKSTTAATALAPGSDNISRTSADGNGNKWVVASEDTNALDTTNGRISFLDIASVTLGFGIATADTSLDDPADIFAQYDSAMSIGQTVTVR